MDQLALFVESVPAVPVSVPKPSYGVPPGVRQRWDRAMQPDVAEAALAIAAARPGEWLTWSAFRAVIDKYQIGFCFGQVLARLVRAGQIEERKVYFGRGVSAEKPGSPNYEGFGHVWRTPSTEAA